MSAVGMEMEQAEDREPSAEPESPMQRFFTMSRRDLQLEDSRERFEGKEEYEEVRHRLQQKMGGRAKPRESDRFLNLMRERGRGNIALAWRRWFDSDGDGTLSFREFCSALIELKYKGDVSALWTELGGNKSGVLSLDQLDKPNAAILDYFGTWCCQPCFGGPLEVFKMIDADGSDSLDSKEFTEGLRDLGFYDSKDLLPSLCDENAVLANLFPLLDTIGTGCIAPAQMVFLEKDGQKKEQLERQIARIAKHGAQAAPEPLHNDAQRMLHKLAMSTTMVGGKDWKPHASDLLYRGPPSRQATRRFMSSSSSSSLRPSSSLSASAGRPGPRSPSSKAPPALPHVGSEPSLPPLSPVSTQDISAGRSACGLTPKNVDRVALVK